MTRQAQSSLGSGSFFFDLGDRFRAPSPTLAELIYVSRRHDRFDDTSLVNMIADAAVRNYLAGVSGRLWYSEGYFLQVLEGNGGAVDAFYARIAADHRHNDVRLIRRRALGSRRFDRPMWLFRGDDDLSFRRHLDPNPSVADDAFDGTCQRLIDVITRASP